MRARDHTGRRGNKRVYGLGRLRPRELKEEKPPTFGCWRSLTDNRVGRGVKSGRSTIEFLKRRRGEEQEHEHGLHRDVSSFTWSISLAVFLSPVVLCLSSLVAYDLLLDSKITHKKPHRDCKNTCRSPRHDSTRRRQFTLVELEKFSLDSGNGACEMTRDYLRRAVVHS